MNIRRLYSLTICLVAAPIAAQEPFSLSGNRVAVYNVAGEVQVVAGSASETQVEVTRGGADSDALRMETGEVCGANALRIIYPEDRIIYRSRGRGNFNSTQHYSTDGVFGGHNNWHHGVSWGCDHDNRWGEDRLEVGSRGRGTEAWADVTVRVAPGTTVEIYLLAGTVTASNIEGSLITDVGSAGVDARNINGNVYIDTGSGRVFVSGVNGDAIIDTGSGSVEVSDVVGENLLVDTGSGSVRGDNIRVADFNIDTGSGGVTFNRLNAPVIYVDTGSGSVSLDVDRSVDLRDVYVDTGSGRVDLTLPETLDGRVELDTGSGSIEMDLPVSVRRWERDHVEGRIGEGGSDRLYVDTSSGGIRIRRS